VAAAVIAAARAPCAFVGVAAAPRVAGVTKAAAAEAVTHAARTRPRRLRLASGCVTACTGAAARPPCAWRGARLLAHDALHGAARRDCRGDDRRRLRTGAVAAFAVSAATIPPPPVAKPGMTAESRWATAARADARAAAAHA
jgi:hypothetical protein